MLLPLSHAELDQGEGVLSSHLQPADHLCQPAGSSAKRLRLESFALLLLRVINLTRGIYGCFQSTGGKCVHARMCVCACVHASVPLTKSCSWKKLFLVLRFPRKGKI